MPSCPHAIAPLPAGPPPPWCGLFPASRTLLASHILPTGHILPVGRMLPVGHMLPVGQPVSGVPAARPPSDRVGSGSLVHR